MNIEKFIDEWIAAGNSYDTKKYLSFYQPDAILTDPSVGKKFIGIKGVEEYFNSYFIGYKTQTEKVELRVKDQNHAHLEVEFKGDFPEGRLRGSFEFTFKEGKITAVRADLS